MNILVLHGPNMNLIGIRSAQIGERITLDKIDTALKQKAKLLHITLKTLQTHNVSKAITFLQRNRNWGNGLLFTPGPWAIGHYDLLDILLLIHIPMIEIFFSSKFMPKNYGKQSLFKQIAIESITDHPLKAYTSGLEKLHTHLTSM